MLRLKTFSYKACQRRIIFCNQNAHRVIRAVSFLRHALGCGKARMALRLATNQIATDLHGSPRIPNKFRHKEVLFGSTRRESVRSQVGSYTWILIRVDPCKSAASSCGEP